MPNNCNERNSEKTKMQPFCEQVKWCLVEMKSDPSQHWIHCLFDLIIDLACLAKLGQIFILQSEQSTQEVRRQRRGEERGNWDFYFLAQLSPHLARGPDIDTVSVLIVVIITSMLNSDISGSKISLNKEQLCLHIQISNCNNSEQSWADVCNQSW